MFTMRSLFILTLAVLLVSPASARIQGGHLITAQELYELCKTDSPFCVGYIVGSHDTGILLHTPDDIRNGRPPCAKVTIQQVVDAVKAQLAKDTFIQRLSTRPSWYTEKAISEKWLCP